MDTKSSLMTQVGGSHYLKHSIQPIEYIISNRLPFADGCIVKYITRHRDKGGADDIRKIMHYCKLILEHEYAET